MSLVLETTPDESTDTAQRSVGQQLQSETTAVRLHIRWPGVRKSLGRSQKQQAATTFAAEANSVTISKKLLDTSHPAFRVATTVRSQAVKYWKSNTLPYIEPGVRLLRRIDTQTFEVFMTSVQGELADAVQSLERHYGELIDQARDRLGELFDASDYEASLSDLFAIDWDYPSSSPPDYLLQLSPQLYQRECERMQARFEDSVAIAEQAFAEELSQLVGHLAERLNGQPDGSAKVFRDSAVNNLVEFFDRFQRLNIRSNDQLDQLVEQARSVIGGNQAGALRTSGDLRQRVARDLTRIEASLDGWLTDRPRRSIMRRGR